jgi:glucokinase
MSHVPNTLSLVADIGGTNTRVALADGHRVLPQTTRKYRNVDYPDLETVLRKFISEEGDVDTLAACVAVAGPVQNGRATLTNLDWTIDEATLAAATHAETVAILNDLQAQGHALDHLSADNIRPVIQGATPKPAATKLVIGVGTGFNATPVFQGVLGRLAAPSESGHVNLPTSTAQDLRLSAYLQKCHGFAAVEDVLSGRGLERVYAFLGDEASDPRELKAAQIMDALAQASDPRAVETAEIFVRILGMVCGNLALTQLPFGGVFLVGGVSRAFAPYLARFGFQKAFCEKGRFANFMETFPVSVIEDDFAALTGSATYLVDLMAQSQA